MTALYGKGAAMMQKMGFQGGGLGAREDGIANPIEVVKRQGRQGLQDDGEMLNQDLYGHDKGGGRRSIEELLSSKATTVETKGEGWKRDVKAKKPRTVYTTAAEVASAPSSMRIVDMRGPQVRVASSLSELAASISNDSSVKSLKELRHNAHLLVQKYEERIRVLAEKKKHAEDTLLAVARERERLEAASSLGKQDLQCCRRLADEVELLRERQDTGLLDFRELGTSFVRMRAQHPSEFEALNLVDVAFALAVPVARRELVSWAPLQSPERIVSMLVPWKPLTETNLQRNQTFCEHIFLPSLRAELCTWNVEDFEACLKLFESCGQAMPATTVDALAEQVLLPRLKTRLESWDPRHDAVPAHIWIHPWLPILKKSMECLWAALRFRLSKALDRWDTCDRWARDALSPWHHVLDPTNWEPLIEKVLARLERRISEMPVRPDGQDVAPIKDLIAWMAIVPASSLARVLHAAFFPHWHAALREWLRVPSCEYEEVLRWYQCWKQLFPEQLLGEGIIQRHFAHGLVTMRHFMAGGSTDGGVESPPPQIQKQPLPQQDGKATVAAAADSVTLSLSDYLAEVAGEHSLVFRPKRAQHLGKQVYQFGGVSIYLDRNAVFAATNNGQDTSWQLVSLEHLLTLARASKSSERKGSD